MSSYTENIRLGLFLRIKKSLKLSFGNIIMKHLRIIVKLNRPNMKGVKNGTQEISVVLSPSRCRTTRL